MKYVLDGLARARIGWLEGQRSLLRDWADQDWRTESIGTVSKGWPENLNFYQGIITCRE